MALAELVGHLRQGPLTSLSASINPAMQRASLFDHVPASVKAAVLAEMDAAAAPVLWARARGTLVGLAVADALGHNFEFLPVCDERGDSWLEFPCAADPAGFRVHNALNQFNLRPGQWTDDTSMALCLADSLLAADSYDGSSVRVWFYNWWFSGLNNAFRLDRDRVNLFGGESMSVGLGGNIAQSLSEIYDLAFEGRPIPPRYLPADGRKDAGNGSLMRLAPVVLRYHTSIELARAQAYESSLTTHSGEIAAEACAFMAHVLVRALERPVADDGTAAAFLDACRAEYLADVLPEAAVAGNDARIVIRRLVAADEGAESLERNWNWRAASLDTAGTLRRRGRSYNGHPCSPAYFGSFCVDGLAMALFAMYNTRSFNEAIVRVVNLCGDADTTGAICGQMAGAFYGVDQVHPAWRQNLAQWDEREIELRAVALVASAGAA